MPNQNVFETPVVQIGPKIFAKLESIQVGGSHKARAAAAAIIGAEQSGLIAPNRQDVLIEKTGGNFGMGLVAHGIARGYLVHLLIRPSFSRFKRFSIGRAGATLFGIEEMEQGRGNAEILENHAQRMRAAGHNVHFVDQFNNVNCIEAHKKAAEEYAGQLIRAGVNKNARIGLVKCVGSSASLRAYRQVFSSHFQNLTTVVVQPEGCNITTGMSVAHPFQGASVGGGGPPPFFYPALADEILSVDHQQGLAETKALMQLAGVSAGPSSGLAFHGAQMIAERFDVVAFLVYDSGEAYLADQFANSGGA